MKIHVNTEVHTTGLEIHWGGNIHQQWHPWAFQTDNSYPPVKCFLSYFLCLNY